MDLDTVDRILKDYGIDIDRSELKAAFNHQDGDTSLSQWASLHLGHETLLTPDELTLYSALTKSGFVDHFNAASKDSDTVGLPYRNESEVRRAIDELNRSTAAISKQTETLRQQQEALARFAKSRIEDEVARSDFDAVRMHKLAVEIRNAKGQVEELSRSLETKISEVEEQTHNANQDLQQSVGTLLESDDKLLRSLEKLSNEFNLGDSRDDEAINKLQETCMKLIKCTVEMMRCKLDRTYLEALSKATRNPDDGGSASAEDVQTLQEELDSLYSEIFPVVQMSVENQYMRPAMRKIKAQNAQALDHASVAVDYIQSCLNYLLEHTNALLDRVETYRSHQAATAMVVSTARAELSTPVPKPRKRPDETRSPTRRRKSSTTSHGSPARTRSNTGGSLLRRRRSSNTLTDEKPIDTLLRILGVSLPEGDGPLAVREQVAALSGILAERTAKADEVGRSAQLGFEETTAMHLADAKRAVTLLRDCVLADSPFGRVRLVDEEIEASIVVLEQEIERLKGQVDEVDPKNVKVKSEKREELLRRWGPNRQ
ncbi:hypothetical protein jhhlp_001878 [Lomentospora prolificans]|uniref:HAUS augmin-like complex subunit 3 N-terminal domain-containing protein n=1 Tax=Lomentospora prolificans TaxID=41688 RepID=A0A2N3NCH4_9PEZI|nr:hypothetical protein jhhlp_001878 [Lomentospora prolificans]